MTTALIVSALIAWILQIGLGWLQVKRFNHAFISMRKGSYIGIGRNSNGRFKPRVLIALSFDEHQNVVDSLLMRGLTVFSLPKKINILHGMHLSQINPEAVFPQQLSCQNALMTALIAR
ncbi:transcriptional regulator GutM [Orbus sturtevantii]|uniref:transcriptional regulator GutM n=1 Tax=Orbus sturtevantii TaxID=3074109 RepID=UPI00370D8BDA